MLKIRWHKRAVAQLYEVADYILSNFGESTRQEFMNEVEHAVLSLADMPSIGKCEPLLAHRKQTYRSIVVRRLNKVVYYVKDDIIHIAAFWDTRREPKNQFTQIK